MNSSPDDSLFKYFTRKVRVSDLYTPYYSKAQVGSTSNNFISQFGEEEYFESWESPHAVYDKNKFLGVVWGEDVYCEDCKNLGAIMEQPSINDIVTADSSVLDIVPLFAHRKRRYLCVLDGNEHVGIISFGALDSPEFRMCLLIKTLELEDLALKLISYGAKESWNALNKLRQNKVIENYERKHRKKCDYKIGVPSIPYEELLKCTYHCDKYTIINSRGMLSGISKSELNDLRKRVEEVRNSFAHSSDVSKSGTFLYDPFGMKKFLEDVNLLDVSLRNAIAVKKNAPVFL